MKPVLNNKYKNKKYNITLTLRGYNLDKNKLIFRDYPKNMITIETEISKFEEEWEGVN